MSDDFDEFEQLEPDVFDPLAIAEAQEKAKQDLATDEEDKVDALRRIKGAYHRIFVQGKPDDGDVELVMTDLCEFCCAHTTTYNPRPGGIYIGEGRRQVLNRIKGFTQLDLDALMRRYM